MKFILLLAAASKPESRAADFIYIAPVAVMGMDEGTDNDEWRNEWIKRTITQEYYIYTN